MSAENAPETRQPSDVVHTFTLETREGPLRSYGRLIGYGTSQSQRHRDHVDGGHSHASRGERCSACRWNEVRLFKLRHPTTADELYLVHTLGVSVVPDEFTKCRTAWATGGYEVVELLTVRPRDGDVFLPGPAARALAAAAELDEGIRRAYVDRAVV